MNSKNLNKFEIAAELDSKEKRNAYLSMLYTEKRSDRDMMEIIDTVKLSTENHPKELLLSPEWQKGYECCLTRTQRTLHDLLEGILLNSNSTLNASANLSIGQDLILQLSAHSFTNKKTCDNLLKRLEGIASSFNSGPLSMYDPEINPLLGTLIPKSKDKLYYWTEENLMQQS
ncbi:MAG: hypothetical protein V3V19_08600 [Cocleimonas sp.]